MDENNRVTFSSWGTDGAKQDCCRWKGVACDNRTGHVLKLDFGEEFQLKANQFQPLRGKISSQLIELQHLEYLDLSWNDLNRSQIPEFIGSLSNLRTVNNLSKLVDLTLDWDLAKWARISQNVFKLRRIFRSLIFQISFQVGFGAMPNHLSGELPDSWAHFDALVVLDLSNNVFSGEISTTMGSLFGIETKKLNNNVFVGELPSSLKNCGAKSS
ncbi:hypothetical protein EV1_000221 [Malus domestica]